MRVVKCGQIKKSDSSGKALSVPPFNILHDTHPESPDPELAKGGAVRDRLRCGFAEAKRIASL
jgi:hypothetical protein